jgi:molybdopterin-guanine dinucleotide biosynthesis protein A
VSRGEASPKVAGFVLAGGGSTRFGQDKALVRIGEQPLLVRLCTLLRGETACVTAVGSPAKYSGFDAHCIPDRWPGEGPLGGIITALLATAQTSAGLEWNLIVGCDMPFLTREWLAYLVERALGSPAEVVVPQSRHGLEPLCACWRTSAAEKLQRAFAGGVRKITDATKHLQMEVLDETRWKRFDTAGRLFWNMNTPSDYDEAKRTLGVENDERPSRR